MPKPGWLKAGIASGTCFKGMRNELHSHLLHTVCEEAHCPNIAECWNAGTATFMVLGTVCTRNCSFCAVESAKKGQPLDQSEPQKIAEAVKKFGLRYTVLTSVDRDDLHDLGAVHFAACIKAVRDTGARVEALIPDFNGSINSLRSIIEARPDVIGHNLETVERLQGLARDSRASYPQSLKVLSTIKKLSPKTLTKSSIMLGLGESRKELLQAMDDLRAAQCDFLTLGQYLQPSKRNLPVAEFIPPRQFEEFRGIALEKGFMGVAAGPLVRSSYRAREMFEASRAGPEAQGKLLAGALPAGQG